MVDHLISFRKININQLHWQFVFQNLNRICAIIKLLKMSAGDNMLRTIEYRNALIYLDFFMNHETFSIDHSQQHDYCLVYDGKRGAFA